MTHAGVIVTGGGSGLGRAIAQAYAAQGARVLVVGRTESALLETAKEYDSISALAADITDPDVPPLIVDRALREFGRVDVLVNNAAALGYRMLAGTDREYAAAVTGTNLLAPIFITQCALDALEASGGTVVNLSSAGSLGIRSWPSNGLYGATKAALDFLTRTWAVELAPRGIRVISVAPGVVDTRSGERMGLSNEEYDGFLQQIAARTPAGRVGNPEEIAWWITQLTRPEAKFATGMVLPIDGALSLT
jgi:nogalaviketone/aklaviketone reductase